MIDLHEGSWRDLLMKYTRLDHNIHCHNDENGYGADIGYFGYMTDEHLHFHFGWLPEFEDNVDREHTINDWIDNMFLSVFDELRTLTGDDFSDDDGYEQIIFWSNKVEKYYSYDMFNAEIRNKSNIHPSSYNMFDDMTDEQINTAINS